MIATSPGASRTTSPPSGMTQASPRTIATSVSGASSWIRIDQGGSSDRAQQEGAARARPVEKAGNRVHRQKL